MAVILQSWGRRATVFNVALKTHAVKTQTEIHSFTVYIQLTEMGFETFQNAVSLFIL